jgi:hypothetical protein
MDHPLAVASSDIIGLTLTIFNGESCGGLSAPLRYRSDEAIDALRAGVSRRTSCCLKLRAWIVNELFPTVNTDAERAESISLGGAIHQSPWADYTDMANQSWVLLPGGNVRLEALQETEKRIAQRNGTARSADSRLRRPSVPDGRDSPSQLPVTMQGSMADRAFRRTASGRKLPSATSMNERLLVHVALLTPPFRFRPIDDSP